MARFRFFACALACAFALAGCGDAYSGLTSPAGIETVGDAAAAVAHRPTGSQYAVAAIGAIDTLGVVLDGLAAVNAAGSWTQRQSPTATRTYSRSLTKVTAAGFGTPPSFCQSFAGYGAGVPALAVTFGWQGMTNGRMSSGGRVSTDAATAAGSTFAGSASSLAALSRVPVSDCANSVPLAVSGWAAAAPFRVSILAVYESGHLTSVNVSRATFGKYSLTLTTQRPGRDPRINGLVADGRIPVASLSSDAFGNGNLTITSTGAQYRLSGWVVAG